MVGFAGVLDSLDEVLALDLVRHEPAGDCTHVDLLYLRAARYEGRIGTFKDAGPVNLPSRYKS